jgi:hypothetical protein
MSLRPFSRKMEEESHGLVAPLIRLAISEMEKEETFGELVNEGANALYAVNELPLALHSMQLTQHIDYVVDINIPSSVAHVVRCSQGIPIVFDTGCSMSITPRRDDLLVICPI